MSTLKFLKAATSLSDLAMLLGSAPKGLSFVIYKTPATSKYVSFVIPKRNGGTRRISAPSPSLKRIQRQLSKVLQDCAEEIRVANGTNDDGPRPDSISHGFRRARSIGSNAARHRNRRHVFNLDLEGFFPACNFGRVYGILVKDKNYALNPKVAQVIAHIACLDGSLPQGSPSSPCIANLIAHVLDIHLTALAQKTGCTYTRYADDLTFSTNLKSVPRSVAVPDSTNPHTWLPGRELERLIVKSGFAINPKKTRMHYLTSRQEVTGLVVNDRVNVKKEYRYLVRAMVHRLVNTGGFERTETVRDATGAVSQKVVAGTLAQLQGMLGFIDSVDYCYKPQGDGLPGSKTAKMVDDKNEELNGKRVSKTDPARELSVYGKFLFFRNFYSADRPVILAEGKTDNVYITTAIRRLASTFPSLATIDGKGAVRLSVRPLKYTGKILGKHLKLFGGANNLASFLGTYKSALALFKAPGKKQPVIMLVDNDNAGRAVMRAAEGKFDLVIKGTEEFVHLAANLYLVWTPLVGTAANSCPEDLFDSAAKAIPHNGLKFDPSSEADTKKSYGKSTFAYKVVVPKAHSIDFKGFIPLLERFAKVIAHHQALTATTAKGAGAAPAPTAAPRATPVSKP